MRFPKTQSCQTEPFKLVSELEPVIEATEAKEEDTRSKGGALEWFRHLVGFLTLLLLFTFMCGYETEGRVYYPITYSPFRFVHCPKYLASW